MSGLVRLYPKAWRDRYELEFSALLEERRPTLLDATDILRGAVDAHLHPYLAAGVDAPRRTHRIPGLLAVAGGAIWTWQVLYLMFWADPNRDWADLILPSMLLMFLSLPGDYMAAHGRQIAVAFGLLGASILLANLLGWPLGAFAAAFFYLLIVCGMLTLASIRAGIGTPGRLLLIGVSVGIPLLVGLIPITGLASLSESTGRLLLGPTALYGLAWLLVGIRLAIRGAPTFVEQPHHAVNPEVSAS